MDDCVVLKAAIQHQYCYLVQNLEPPDIIDHLFAQFILSNEEKEHLDCQGHNFGRTAQAKLLIDYVLKKNEEHIQIFLRVLNNTQDDAYKKVVDSVKDIKSGKILLQEKLDVKNLTQLKIRNTNGDGYLDLERVLFIFPSINAIDAIGINFYDSDQCHSADKVMGKSLQRVHIFTENITLKQLKILQRQLQLQSLYLNDTNMLHVLAKSNITTQWKYLEELKILEEKSNDTLDSSHLSILKQLLVSVADCLQILSLSLPIEDVIDISDLTDIISTMKHLKRLGVYFSPRHYTHHTLKCLAKCNSIEHLVLSREAIEDYEEDVIPLLCQFSSIKTLDVLDDNEGNSYNIAAEYEKRLKKKNIKINYVTFDSTMNKLDDIARLCFEQL